MQYIAALHLAKETVKQHIQSDFINPTEFSFCL